MQDNGEFLILALELQTRTMEAMNVKEELRAKGVADDPVRACTIGMKFDPLFQKISAANVKMFAYMRKAIAEAK